MRMYIIGYRIKLTLCKVLNHIICAETHKKRLKNCKVFICTNPTNICYNLITKNVGFYKQRIGLEGLDMLHGKYSYETICDYILYRCDLCNIRITNLRLQKILYYVQGYYLRFLDYPAFDSQIQKWQYGPVVPEAYYDYCSFGRNDIVITSISNNIAIEKEEQRIINLVIDKCTKLNIGDLIEKTHNESPWKDTNALKDEIPIDTIYEFFIENDPLEIK